MGRSIKEDCCEVARRTKVQVEFFNINLNIIGKRRNLKEIALLNCDI